MQNKIKFIIIAIAAGLLISLFVNIQTYRAKVAVENQREALKEENASLQQNIDKISQDNANLGEKLNLLTRDYEKLSAELVIISHARIELQEKLEAVQKEKDELNAQLAKIATQQQSEAVTDKSSAVSSMADSYWASILKRKADLELQVENLKNEMDKMRLGNKQLETDKNDLELEVNNYVRQNDDLKRQIEYIGSSQKSIDSLTQDLVREKNDKFQIQNSLSMVKGENNLLRRQLKSLGKRNISLEKRLVELNTKNKNLEDSFAKVESMLKEQMFKMANLKGELDVQKEAANAGTASDASLGSASASESVELPPIIISPKNEGAQFGSTILTGKILSVDRGNNFAIVDLGENAGVKKGDTFKAYRDNRPIADLVVIESRPNISACDIRNEGIPIAIGDKVK